MKKFWSHALGVLRFRVPERYALVVQKAVEEENRRRGMALGILLASWFSVVVVLDIVHYVPQGNWFYVVLDSALVAGSALAAIVLRNASSRRIIATVSVVGFVGVMVFGALVSVAMNQPTTLLVVTLVYLSVMFLPATWVVCGLSAAAAVLLVLGDYRLEVYIEVAAFLFWALMLSRMQFAYLSRVAVAEAKLTDVVQNQGNLIEERTRSLKLLVDERDALLREVHHRVKNNLQVILSLIHLASEDSADVDPRSVLEETESRILTMVLAHEHLYESEGLSDLDIGRYLESVVEAVRRQTFGGRSGSRARAQFAAARCSADVAISLGLLLAEMTLQIGTGSLEVTGDLSSEGATYEITVSSPDAPSSPRKLSDLLIETLCRQLDAQYENAGLGVARVRVSLSEPKT